ncbi:MAG: 50S ribosomal protein L30e [Candidatus Micrarchaeota archaeon]
MARKKAAKKSAAGDISKAIRMCVDTGKTEFGIKGAIKHSLLGQGKLIIAVTNTPADEMADLQKYCSLSNLPLYIYGGTSLDLGSLCGKPFPISALWVSKAGDSPILEIVKKKK